MALRWLLLIPFACLVAMGAGLVALGVASVASPAVALTIGGGIERLIDILFGLADSGIDPAPAAQAALALVTRLGFAIVVAPVLVVAIGSELFRLRSGLIQSVSTGLLAALLPLAMLRISRVPNTAELQIISGLFLVGVVSGFVYWLVAGRGAGGDMHPPVSR